MARNGSGAYSLHADAPAVTSTVIDSSKYNNINNDLATALTESIARDGQTTITANLPMTTYRHTGVGDAVNLTDYASANQVVDNTLTYGGASAAGTDTYAVSLPISPGAYVAGNRFQFKADVANTGACTLNINALGAKSIKLADGGDPLTGDIQASVVDVIYDGTNFVLLNPSNTSDGTWTPTMDGSTANASSYTTQWGVYSRTGNVVTYSCVVVISAKGSLEGSLSVGGLPIASATDANAIHSASCGYSSGVGTVTGPFTGQIGSNSSEILIKEWASAVPTAVADTDVGTTFGIGFSGTYFV